MQHTQLQSLGQEDPLEKEMATYSSIPVWKILWTEESKGSQRVGHNLVSKQQQHDNGICSEFLYQTQVSPKELMIILSLFSLVTEMFWKSLFVFSVCFMTFVL